MPVEAPPINTNTFGPLVATTMRLVDPTTGSQLYAIGPFTSPRLNSLDFGTATVRSVSQSITGTNGELDTTRWIGARAITAVVTFPQGTSADPAIDTLNMWQNPGLRMYMYAQRPGWLTERRALVRGAGMPCPPGTLRQGQAAWVAPAGVFEDSVLSGATLKPSGTAAGGVAVPLSVPMVFSGGLAPGAGLVNVSGNMPTAPVINIWGPCADPIIRLVSTGQQISFAGLSLADGDYLHIDMAARTVFLNGDPNQSRYSRIDMATLSWWSLPVGTGIEVLFSASAASSPCQANLTWRASWLV